MMSPAHVQRSTQQPVDADRQARIDDGHGPAWPSTVIPRQACSNS